MPSQSYDRISVARGSETFYLSLAGSSLPSIATRPAPMKIVPKMCLMSSTSFKMKKPNNTALTGIKKVASTKLVAPALSSILKYSQ